MDTALKHLRIRASFVMFWCFVFLRILIDSFSNGQICLPTWQVLPNIYSTGGWQEGPTNLQGCIALCEGQLSCVAIDFNVDTSPPCWLHQDPNDLLPVNVYDYSTNGIVSQYIVNRTSCFDNSSASCSLNWTWLTKTHSVNGVPYNFWTPYDCFTFCSYTSGCVAVDFDINSSPPCWMHTSFDDLTPQNTYDDSNTAVQYQMNRTCPTPVTADINLGSCTGSAFRSDAWCPTGEEIHIVDATYEIHPLCCFPLSNAEDPPDSSALFAIDVMRLSNDAFVSKVEACEGATDCSSLIAEPYISNAINNVFCPNQGNSTNYVSITYTCVSQGHSDPSTTQSLTSYQIPILSSPSNNGSHQSRATSLAAGTVTVPSNVTSLAAGTVTVPSSSSYSQDSTVSKNTNSGTDSDKVLAGFGVALGTIAVLALITCVVWYIWRKRRSRRDYDVRRTEISMDRNKSSTEANNNEYNV